MTNPDGYNYLGISVLSGSVVLAAVTGLGLLSLAVLNDRVYHGKKTIDNKVEKKIEFRENSNIKPYNFRFSEVKTNYPSIEFREYSK